MSEQVMREKRGWLNPEMITNPNETSRVSARREKPLARRLLEFWAGVEIIKRALNDGNPKITFTLRDDHEGGI